MTLDYFPPSLLSHEAKDATIEWIRILPIDPFDKKRLYVLWAETYNVPVTRIDLVKAAPGLADEEP